MDRIGMIDYREVEEDAAVADDDGKDMDVIAEIEDNCMESYMALRDIPVLGVGQVNVAQFLCAFCHHHLEAVAIRRDVDASKKHSLSPAC